MSDQVTEIREALDLLKGSFDAPRLTPSQILAIGSLMRVAREHLDLLESDALIIRRDENGNWPEWAVEKVREKLWANSGMPIGSALNLAVLVFDQMASSQGAEHE